jgi:hypothetical protein
VSEQFIVGGRSFQLGVRLNAYSTRSWWGYRRLPQTLGDLSGWRAQLYLGHRLFELTYADNPAVR